MCRLSAALEVTLPVQLGVTTGPRTAVSEYGGEDVREPSPFDAPVLVGSGRFGLLSPSRPTPLRRNRWESLPCGSSHIDIC